MECPDLKNESFKEPPQAVPNEYKIENDSIQAYRLFYTFGKNISIIGRHVTLGKKEKFQNLLKKLMKILKN